VAIRRRARAALVLLALAAAAGYAALRGHVGLVLERPHANIAPNAAIAGTLRGELDAASSDWRPRSTQDLVAFALERTRDHLVPDPDHARDLTFLNDVRRANAEEYAQLFTAVLRHVGELRNVPGRATIVRSGVRWFGRVPPPVAWRTHHWVQVEDGAGLTWCVSPMLDDAGLGWDVCGAVRR
jgi:hypothetical protein